MTRRLGQVLGCVIAAVCLVMTGCQAGGQPVAPVQGTVTRFRVNLFQAGGRFGACLRLVPAAIPAFDWAEFPLELARLCL